MAKALAERAQEESGQRAVQQSGQLSQPGSGPVVHPASTRTASGGLLVAASRVPAALPCPPAPIPAAAQDKPATFEIGARVGGRAGASLGTVAGPRLPPLVTNPTVSNDAPARPPTPAPIPTVMHSSPAGEGASGNASVTLLLQ